MITAKLLLSHRRPDSILCVRVSILLSDARVVVLFARQLQSSQRTLSSGARNVERNAPSFCSAPGLHQEIFHSIRFTLLSLRVGTRSLMVKPTAPERTGRNGMVLRGAKASFWLANLNGATQTKVSNCNLLNA